jgi:hypothetical protein
MEGPDSNCPQDYWSGLEPVGPLDPDKWKQWNREQNRKSVRENQKPQIKNKVQQIEQNADIDADAETALAVLVACGRMQAWLADEILAELQGTGT